MRSSSGAARASGCSPREGFRDSLEMGTEQRYDIYDLFLSFPDPLVPRRHRLEIGERVDRDGRVISPLDPDEVRDAVRRLVDDGIEAVAVCFLHSYANPAHEQAARALIERENSRTCSSRSPPTWSRSCANIRAPSRPAPTPTCSR